MKNCLEIKDLCKSYGDFALDHVNLTIPGGTIMGLIGENGAGKTTTIKCILNLIRRDSGTITILGKDNVADERAAKMEAKLAAMDPEKAAKVRAALEARAKKEGE